MTKIRIELIKFIAVGFVSTAFNFIFYFLIYKVFDQILLASVIGYSIGIINSYLIGKKWVFKDKSKINKKSILLFLIVYFIGGILSSFLIFLTNRIMNNYIFAWFLGTCYSTTNNFLGSKYLVFRKLS